LNDRLPLSDPRRDLGERLLRSREAKGLTWSIVARLAYLIVGTVLTLYLAQSKTELIGTLVLLAGGAALASYCLFLARREERLRFVGLAGVSYDLLALAAFPIAWHYSAGGSQIAPGLLMKNELFAIAMMLLIINSVGLKPLYPAIMALGAVSIHLAVFWVTLSDPRLVLTRGALEHFMGPAVNPGFFVARMLALLLAGSFLVLLTRAARQTIHDVVELEESHLRIREEQARMIWEGKMTALSSLVAGIAHEMNTPLGALETSTTIIERCTGRLAESLNPGSIDGPHDRGAWQSTLKHLTDSAGLMRQATTRLAGLVVSVKGFARLDEAETQRADLRAGIDSALSLIPDSTKGAVEVIKDYRNAPPIDCRPKELNQVFMTLLMNAFEAMSGSGSLRIGMDTADGRLRVEISDTGKGMSQQQMDNLFEIGFHKGKGRVSMGLGLATARAVVQRHGGTLSVRSELGKGSRFVVSLPIRGHS
jgi:two-component system, NtrC family, sensor kinase